MKNRMRKYEKINKFYFLCRCVIIFDHLNFLILFKTYFYQLKNYQSCICFIKRQNKLKNIKFHLKNNNKIYNI